jgi:hypothetical protein
MTQKVLSTLLVGMHFRPPAKQMVNCLPSGTLLRLQAEPENPYDPQALQVWVASSLIPESQWEGLIEALQGTGFSLEDLLGQEEWHLGYVARSGGKPLEKAGLAAGNAEFAAALAEHPDAMASLGVHLDGAPMVQLFWE